MRIVIENADTEDFNELAKLARQGKINTFYMTDEDEETPQGRWVHSIAKGWECTNCNQTVKEMPTENRKATYNYCPNCGADMRGGAENDT